MPDDSNGVYNVPAGTLVNTGDTVLPSQHNPWATDSSQAISNRFSKDGRAPATGDWDINNFRLKQVGTPTASGDATNKGYVDGQITTVNQNAEKISPQSGAYTALLADKATSFRFTAAATLSLTAAATLGANWWCEVWATNGNLTIDPNGTETINGSLTIILQTGQAAKIFCTGTQFFAWIFSDSRSGPQLQGFSFGLGLSTNATDAANDVDIAVGAAAADVSPYALMQLNTALTKRIDAAWAVGNNNGGLDTGTVAAAGTYYIWLIQRSDTLVTDALFSLSSTAPTMPANYDRKRLLGFITRNSSTNSIPRFSLRSVINSGAPMIPSGVSLIYTGIPVGVAKFTVHVRNLVFSANAQPFIRVGPSSGVISTGYEGIVSATTGGSAAVVVLSTSALLDNGASTTVVNGEIIFTRVPGFYDWEFSGSFSLTTGANRKTEISGGVSIGSELDRFQFSSIAGTSTMSGTAIWADWEF